MALLPPFPCPPGCDLPTPYFRSTPPYFQETFLLCKESVPPVQQTFWLRKQSAPSLQETFLLCKESASTLHQTFWLCKESASNLFVTFCRRSTWSHCVRGFLSPARVADCPAGGALAVQALPGPPAPDPGQRGFRAPLETTTRGSAPWNPAKGIAGSEPHWSGQVCAAR